MQTEKSQPEGKRIMPETRFTDFPASSVELRIGISQSSSETGLIIFLTYDIKNCYLLSAMSFIFDITIFYERHSVFLQWCKSKNF